MNCERALYLLFFELCGLCGPWIYLVFWAVNSVRALDLLSFLAVNSVGALDLQYLVSWAVRSVRALDLLSFLAVNSVRSLDLQYLGFWAVRSVRALDLLTVVFWAVNSELALDSLSFLSSELCARVLDSLRIFEPWWMRCLDFLRILRHERGAWTLYSLRFLSCELGEGPEFTYE